MSDLPSLVIVGGGSAGWLTASYINSVVNADRRVVDVTLVESPAVGRIGVGEATVPSIRETLSRIGIGEKEFLRSADATFKSAIGFKNWLHNDGEVYFHPFDQRTPKGRADTAARDWLGSARDVPWADTVSIMNHLNRDGHAPKALGWPDYGSVFPYAYHMDAEKFAGTLADFSKARGVRHIEALVTDVTVGEGDQISSVTLDSGDTLAGDFFVDCSGFRALLIGKALGGDYVDFGQYLMCDRAVAIRVPYDVHRPGPTKPYTMSSALSSGWSWDIPLQGRRGTGYVYSSQFISDDEAEAELRAYEGPHAADLPAKRLQFRVGRRANPWIGNCIAIGLSSGFIEPLESSALYTVEASIAALLEHVDFGDLGNSQRSTAMRDAYNGHIARLYDEILEFVNLHYCLTRRDDTAFWREVQKPERIVPALAKRLNIWEHKPPTQYDFETPLQLFSVGSYEYILFGMDAPEQAGAGGIKTPVQVPQDIVTGAAKSKAKFPSHDDWLAALG
ncbi:MAG: tryptophan halogenase family protein [Marinomonas sp.]|uniref:tryptophan halogenase family protein n=1 Tax=Alphaproteobacteria TaxID=28211 RepID=UPI003266BBDE